MHNFFYRGTEYKKIKTIININKKCWEGADNPVNKIWKKKNNRDSVEKPIFYEPFSTKK